MLLLIAIPVFVAVGAFQRYLAIYAPTNVLIRRVRSSPAHIGTALELAALATVLLVAMRGVQLCIHAGGPGWLNLVVLVFAWDAIKVGCLAVGSLAREIVSSLFGLRSRTPARFRERP